MEPTSLTRKIKSFWIVVINVFLFWFLLEGSFFLFHRGFLPIKPTETYDVSDRKRGLALDHRLRPRVDEDHPLLVPTGFSSRKQFRESNSNLYKEFRVGATQLDRSQTREPIFDFLMDPNSKTRSVLKLKSGELVYDVEYEIDEFGRRKTDNFPGAVPQGQILFFGCSFVFGQGRRQSETLPSLLAKSLTKVRVFNYGVAGAGPHEFIKRIEDTNFAREAPFEKSLGLYLYLPDHIRRSVPSLSTLEMRRNQNFFYGEGQGGAIQRYQSFSQVDAWAYYLRRLLRFSEVLAHFHLDVPFSTSEDDLRFTARLISYMSKSYKSAFPGGEFVVVTYPYKWSQGTVTPYLIDLGVRVLDYSAFDLRAFVKGSIQIHDADPHPSREANEVLAEQMAMDLESFFPRETQKIFKTKHAN